MKIWNPATSRYEVDPRQPEPVKETPKETEKSDEKSDEKTDKKVTKKKE